MEDDGAEGLDIFTFSIEGYCPDARNDLRIEIADTTRLLELEAETVSWTENVDRVNADLICQIGTKSERHVLPRITL